MGFHLFLDKPNPKTVSEHFILLWHSRNFGARENLSIKNSLQIAYLKAAHWIYKQESLSAGRGRLRGEFHACPNTNKSTERHPRVTYYSPPLFPTIANQCSSLQLELHYNLSPQVGLLGMTRKLCSTFFRSEECMYLVCKQALAGRVWTRLEKQRRNWMRVKWLRGEWSRGNPPLFFLPSFIK